MAASPVDDKAALEKVVTELATSNDAWQAHMMEGKYIIRPSGNPLTAEQQKAMMSTEGMEMGTQELVAINSMDISGDMAQVTYTAHQVFTFKGTPNDDVAVMLIVFKKDESGSWKILTGMRSQGRPPSDPKPEFPN